jgi:DHA1 family multidrug resistance protein-like MFS transporter
MVATETPDEHLGKSLGAMQTTQYLGTALGPVIGGMLADALGYRAVFPISSALMFVAFASVTLFVRESRNVPRRKVGHARLKTKGIRLSPVLTRDNAVLLAALGANSFALRVLSPIMALYIQALSPGSERLATLAGTIISASAITSSISAMALGRLGDKIGQKSVLVACSMGATLIFIPQALATSAAQLLLFRAIQGIFMGGILPTTNALLAKSTTAEWRGTIFGLATSASAGGRAIGPLAGAGVANIWGLAAPFWVTGAVYMIITVLVSVMVRVQPTPVTAEERTSALAAENKPCQTD